VTSSEYADAGLCTALCAVNLAAITVAADKNLGLAASAQKQTASRRCRRQQGTWTAVGLVGFALDEEEFTREIGTRFHGTHLLDYLKTKGDEPRFKVSIG
jgi:hypothetical protein